MIEFQKQIKLISCTLYILAEQIENLSNIISKCENTPKNKRLRPTLFDRNGVQIDILDRIYKLIRRSRKGLSNKSLQKKTGLRKRQIENAIYKLKNNNKIKCIRRGIYIKGDYA